MMVTTNSKKNADARKVHMQMLKRDRVTEKS